MTKENGWKFQHPVLANNLEKGWRLSSFFWLKYFTFIDNNKNTKQNQNVNDKFLVLQKGSSKVEDTKEESEEKFEIILTQAKHCHAQVCNMCMLVHQFSDD